MGRIFRARTACLNILWTLCGSHLRESEYYVGVCWKTPAKGIRLSQDIQTFSRELELLKDAAPSGGQVRACRVGKNARLFSEETCPDHQAACRNPGAGAMYGGDILGPRGPRLHARMPASVRKGAPLQGMAAHVYETAMTVVSGRGVRPRAVFCGNRLCARPIRC